MKRPLFTISSCSMREHLPVRPVLIGTFGPPVLACIRSWGRQGFPVGLVAVGSKENGLPSSRYLKKVWAFPHDQLFTVNGAGLITRYLEEFQATGFAAIDEKISFWIHSFKKQLPKNVAAWLTPSQENLSILSKIKQIEVAKGVGFDLLPTYLLDQSKKSRLKVVPNNFPLCLRPSESGSANPGFKVERVISADALEKFMENLNLLAAPIIGQPFMSSPNLVIHGVRTEQGKTENLQGFLVVLKFEGLALSIRPVKLGTELLEKCAAFAEKFQLLGNFHFDFLYDPIKYKAYFLEVNHRFGGTTAKALACGYDEPMYMLKAFGLPNPRNSKISIVTVSNKQALLKYLYSIATGKLSPIDFPQGPLYRLWLIALSSFFFCRDEVLSLGDLRGSAALYLANLKEFLSKK